MAQTEVETRTVEDYRPNHSLDRIGAYIRRGLIGVSVLFGAYIGIRQMTEQAQPNAPQPAYEHAFIEGDKERITKQIVPEFIYKASYPAWFLNETKFINAFINDYDLITEFDSGFDPTSVLEDGLKVYRKGFYFKKKKHDT